MKANRAGRAQELETRTVVSPLLQLNTGAASAGLSDKHKSQNERILANRVDQLNRQLSELRNDNQREQAQNQALAGKMTAILDVMPAGVVVLDASGRVSQCNQLAIKLLGTDLLHRSWRELTQAVFRRRLDDGHEISTAAGRRLSLSTRALAEGSQGQIVLVTDLTETRRLQDKVSQQMRLSALGQMVSALAHQVRTPLSAAMLYANHLCDSTLDGQLKQKFSSKLRSRLNHIDRQIRDMLLFVKGELPLNDEVSNQCLVSELSEALEIPVKQSGLDVEWRDDCDSCLIRCNLDALVNAIMNLVNNSIQAYEESNIPYSERKLTISMALTPANLLVSVRDYGPGISPIIKDKLHEPFNTTKSQGTGLGLAVVRAVAQAHRGNFTLTSEVQGVKADITIPIINSV